MIHVKFIYNYIHESSVTPLILLVGDFNFSLKICKSESNLQM